MEPLTIANGFYVSNVLPLSHQECSNFYTSSAEVESLSEKQLIGIPGITEITTSGVAQQVNRGGHVKNGVPYFVNGEVLYSLSSDGILTTLGTVEGDSRVSMADNGSQLMILEPGGKGYIYNESATPAFAEITDSDFYANGDPQYVVYIDGYFAVTTDTKKWIVCALNNGLSWDALDFGSAESDPDAIVAPVVVNNQLYIVGATTTEGEQNIGGSGFPFQRNNVFLDKGCAAPNTLISTNSAFFMVGNGPREGIAIWKFTGNQFERVSTIPIETYIQGYTQEELAEAFSWSYAQDGAFFVGFTFTDRSFVMNMANGAWHERKSTQYEQQARWRPNSVISAYESILVGDVIDGRIGKLDTSVYTEYGVDIVGVFSTQPFANKGDEIACTVLELSIESGMGNDAVAKPQVSLAISRDAKTWSMERNRGVGPKGDYKRRVIWRKNGRYSRFVVLRFRISDPIHRTIIKLEFE